MTSRKEVPSASKFFIFPSLSLSLRSTERNRTVRFFIHRFDRKNCCGRNVFGFRCSFRTLRIPLPSPLFPSIIPGRKYGYRNAHCVLRAIEIRESFFIDRSSPPLLLFAMEFYLGHEPLRRYSGVLEHFRYSRYYFQNIWDVGEPRVFVFL